MLTPGQVDIEQLKAKRDVETLVKMLNNMVNSESNWRIRFDAAKALGEIGDAQAVEPLISVLSRVEGGMEQNVRTAAAWALGQIGDKKAVAPLITALRKKENKPIRLRIIEALGMINDDRIGETLIGILKHGDDEERIIAAGILKNKKDKLLVDENQRAMLAVFLERWEEVDKLGLAAIEPLIEALRNKKNNIEFAIIKLGRIGDKRAVEPLINLIRSKKKYSQDAILALGNIGDIRAVEPLIDLIKNNSMFKQDVAWALGKIGDMRAIEPLSMMLLDKKEHNRHAAAEALKKLGGRPKDETQRAFLAVELQKEEEVVSLGVAAINPLMNALYVENESIVLEGVGVWPKVRGWVVQALGKIGDARVISKLLDIVQNPSAVYPAIWAIRNILENSVTSVTTDDLRAIANLQNVKAFATGVLEDAWDSESYDYLKDVDCSDLQTTAKREIIRRGSTV